jgi:hypothetical protein
MEYVYPKLSGFYSNPFCSIAPPGLGNCLFPYARALVHTDRADARMIAPEWFTVNVGPLMRGTKSRNYCDDFKNIKDDVSGLSKLIVLACSRRLEEDSEEAGELAVGRRVIQFSGMKGWFGPINQHRACVRAGIVKRLGNSYIDCNGYLGVHVRLGDFQVATLEELYSGKRNLRAPFSWYLRIIKERLDSGSYKGIKYFTDAKESEIEELLKSYPGVIVSGQTALSDMFSLSSCAAIVGTRSTFALWAYYFSKGKLYMPYGEFQKSELLPHGAGIEYCR